MREDNTHDLLKRPTSRQQAPSSTRVALPDDALRPHPCLPRPTLVDTGGRRFWTIEVMMLWAGFLPLLSAARVLLCECYDTPHAIPAHRAFYGTLAGAQQWCESKASKQHPTEPWRNVRFAPTKGALYVALDQDPTALSSVLRYEGV